MCVLWTAELQDGEVAGGEVERWRVRERRSRHFLVPPQQSQTDRKTQSEFPVTVHGERTRHGDDSTQNFSEMEHRRREPSGTVLYSVLRRTETSGTKEKLEDERVYTRSEKSE